MRPVFQRKINFQNKFNKIMENNSEINIISCSWPNSQKYIWSQMKTPELTLSHQIIIKEHHVTGIILKAALN